MSDDAKPTLAKQGLKRGQIVRMTFADGSAAAFSDCFVSDVYVANGEAYATLLRPYVLESGETGVETVHSVNLATNTWTVVRR